MLLLIILVTACAIIGAFGGSFAAGSSGFIVGGAAGIVIGSIAWYILGTIDRILHERRLDSYFYDVDLG